ncbi:hypothetical protein [Pseudomonas sp. G5(2012)]|uniref:hypothetical protein n=1 Tax=Pseudomonas sp. G5(2012) TaxID=1268068 RepID=UPI0003430DC9|nr:hypothetical protein [Pseudomonas sp. G5(2012)]EPA94946.1 hypothetical protein PG5_45920 [Pseudomonas sp. G5(2012)]
MTEKKDNNDFDNLDDLFSGDFDFGNDAEILSVSAEDTYIEIDHNMGGKTLRLRYYGQFEEINWFYVNADFHKDYPQLDERVLSSISAVFMDLRYYGHDFYCGDFQGVLKDWLEKYVFNPFELKSVEMVKYVIEKETATLFRDLSNTRLHKCRLEREDHKFTPLKWATADEVERLYHHFKKCGRYD